MNKVVFGLMLVGASISPALSEESSHLLPEDSIYSSFDHRIERDNVIETYYQNVLEVFAETFSDDVFGRAIVHPSFRNEYAVALTLNGEKFSIIALEPTVHIWRYSLIEMYKSGQLTILSDDDGSGLQNEIEELSQGLPDKPIDVPVDKCEYALPENIGKQLFVLWGEMLFRTRYVDERPITLEPDNTMIVGFDGVTYHYSFEYNTERLTGKIWSPGPATITGQFVSITNTLVELCRSEDNLHIKRLDKKISKLNLELSKTVY